MPRYKQCARLRREKLVRLSTSWMRPPPVFFSLDVSEDVHLRVKGSVWRGAFQPLELLKPVRVTRSLALDRAPEATQSPSRRRILQ